MGKATMMGFARVIRYCDFTNVLTFASTRRTLAQWNCGFPDLIGTRPTATNVKSDREAERFLDRKDLSDYIVAENVVPARFEFERKTKSLTMRIPASLLDAVKARAARQGIPYQRLIRQALERVVAERG